ncbi:glycosyltransferase [Knoellia sinensis]|uniref:glycosyltransferase n=1 Tax=Knoellia sinensis TaxID=136100 RepID=UPI003CCB8CE2
MAEITHDFGVLYLGRDSPAHGWGDVAINHPHAFIPDTGATALHLAKHLLSAGRPHVLASFGYRGPVRQLALGVARARGITIVTRSDSNIASLTAEHSVKRLVRRQALRLAFPPRTRVWTVGTANERYWAEYVGRSNSIRIPYSTPDLPQSTGIQPSSRTSSAATLKFLYVGRLSPEKRVDLLIQTFRSLAADFARHWRLDIVGDGPESERLRALAGSDPRIHFHGAKQYQDLDEHYLVADALVLPSHIEPWGLVVNEAMAFGCRVIVSDQVGASELVTHPAIGSIFRTGDSESLAAAMVETTQHLNRRPIAPYDPTSDMLADLRGLGGVTATNKTGFVPPDQGPWSKRTSFGGAVVRESLRAVGVDAIPASVSLVETATSWRPPKTILVQSAWNVIPRRDFLRLIRPYPLRMQAKALARRIVAARAIRAAERVVCLTSYLGEVVRTNFAVDVTVAEATAPLDHWRTSNDQLSYRDPCLAIVVGTVTWYKRPDLALRVLKERRPQVRRVRFLGRDDGSGAWAHVRDVANALGLSVESDVVSHSQIRLEYAKAGVCVLPSALESLGFGLSEALLLSEDVLASSIPPHVEIARRIGRSPEWIHVREDGLPPDEDQSHEGRTLTQALAHAEWTRVAQALGLTATNAERGRESLG